jgi:hypothetical protein
MVRSGSNLGLTPPGYGPLPLRGYREREADPRKKTRGTALGTQHRVLITPAFG